jgi:5-methylcytosine-specific restriction endonuclease McrA
VARSGRWSGTSATNRRAELPRNWATEIRPAVIERDKGLCQWRERPDGPICGARGTDVDHIGDKHDHRPEMLQALCEDCHNRKSSRQGNAARWAVRRQRPPERHPGLI